MGRMFWWQLSVLLLAGMAAGAQGPNSTRNGQAPGTPPAASRAAAAVNPANAEFQGPWGGYLISSAFRIDPDRPGVIRLPASVRAGDLIWIRPMRLNSDEYLILQKCIDADCSKAEV